MTDLCDVTPHLHWFLFCHNNFVSRDWLTRSPSACADAEGGFHHGVDAGKRTIASDRIFLISSKTSLIFLARFVRQVTFIRVYVRSGDDSIEKGDEINPLWLTVAIWLSHTTDINSFKPELASTPFPCGDVCWRAWVWMFFSANFYNRNWRCNYSNTVGNLSLCWFTLANAS